MKTSFGKGLTEPFWSRLIFSLKDTRAFKTSSMSMYLKGDLSSLSTGPVGRIFSPFWTAEIFQQRLFFLCHVIRRLSRVYCMLE
jgi:hypothetical protein